MTTESHSPLSSDVWDEGMAIPVMTIDKVEMRERQRNIKRTKRERCGERKISRKERRENRNSHIVQHKLIQLNKYTHVNQSKATSQYTHEHRWAHSKRSCLELIKEYCCTVTLSLL